LLKQQSPKCQEIIKKPSVSSVKMDFKK
jgi:hypothetical protein